MYTWQKSHFFITALFFLLFIKVSCRWGDVEKRILQLLDSKVNMLRDNTRGMQRPLGGAWACLCGMPKTARTVEKGNFFFISPLLTSSLLCARVI